MMIAFADDLKAEVYNLNEQNNVEGGDVLFNQKLGEFIEFHSTVKQLS